MTDENKQNNESPSCGCKESSNGGKWVLIIVAMLAVAMVFQKPPCKCSSINVLSQKSAAALTDKKTSSKDQTSNACKIGECSPKN